MSKEELSLITRLSQVVDQQTKNSRLSLAPETAEQLVEYITQLEPLIEELTTIHQSLYPDQFRYLQEPSDDEKAEYFSSFTDWFVKYAPNSGVKSHVEFAHGLNEGAGVIAAKPIQKDDIILTIPREMMLTCESIIIVPPSDTKISSYQQLIQQFFKTYAIFNRIPSLMIAICLCFHRMNPQSFFTPYVNILPRVIPCTAMATLDDLRVLSPNPVVYASVLRQYKTMLHQYVMMCSILSKNTLSTQKPAGKKPQQADAAPQRIPMITFPLFRWALAVMMSRQNPIPGANPVAVTTPKGNKKSNTPTRPTYRYHLTGSQELALIPGFDFCNHAPPVGYTPTSSLDKDGQQTEQEGTVDDSHAAQINTFYDDSQHASVTIANPSLTNKKTSEKPTQYDVGDQVFIYYGNRTPSQYVLYQGFLPYIPSDTLPVPQHAATTIPLPVTTDEIAKIRSSIRSRLGLSEITFINIPLQVTVSSQTLRPFRSSTEPSSHHNDPSIATSWDDVWPVLYIESLNKQEAGELLVSLVGAALKIAKESSSPKDIPGANAAVVDTMRTTVFPQYSDDIKKRCLEAFKSSLSSLALAYTSTLGATPTTAIQRVFGDLITYEHLHIQKQLQLIDDALGAM